MVEWKLSKLKETNKSLVNMATYGFLGDLTISEFRSCIVVLNELYNQGFSNIISDNVNKFFIDCGYRSDKIAIGYKISFYK